MSEDRELEKVAIDRVTDDFEKQQGPEFIQALLGSYQIRQRVDDFKAGANWQKAKPDREMLSNNCLRMAKEALIRMSSDTSDEQEQLWALDANGEIDQFLAQESQREAGEGKNGTI